MTTTDDLSAPPVYIRYAYSPQDGRCIGAWFGETLVTAGRVAALLRIERAAQDFASATVHGDALDVYAAGRAVIAAEEEPAP